MRRQCLCVCAWNAITAAFEWARNESLRRQMDETIPKKPKRQFISKSRAKHLDGSDRRHMKAFIGRFRSRNCRTLLCFILFIYVRRRIEKAQIVLTHTHHDTAVGTTYTQHAYCGWIYGYIIQLNYLFTFSVTSIQLIIDLFSFGDNKLSVPCKNETKNRFHFMCTSALHLSISLTYFRYTYWWCAKRASAIVYTVSIIIDGTDETRQSKTNTR